MGVGDAYSYSANLAGITKMSKMLCGALKKRKPLDELGDSVYYYEPNVRCLGATSASSIAAAKKKAKHNTHRNLPALPPKTREQVPRTDSPLQRLKLEPIVESPEAWATHSNGDTKSDRSSSQGQGPKSIRMQGQLRISAYVNNGLLTVHVIQAKNLPGSVDSLVDVSLIPDENMKTLFTTESCFGSTNPVYDQKVSYEVLEEDARKRLCLCVWHSKKDGEREFLGCMSFGVRHLIQKNQVNGWFYLLSEEVGRKKHLQMSRKGMPLDRVTPTMSGKIGATQEAPMTGAIQVKLRKSPVGFGFSVKGSNPVKVGRVEEGSPAHCSGLKEGDDIIKINAQNVSRSGSLTVGKILRQADYEVILEVHRSQSALPQCGRTLPSAPSSVTSSQLTLFEQHTSVSSYRSSVLSLWQQSKIQRHAGSAFSDRDSAFDEHCIDSDVRNNSISIGSKASLWDSGNTANMAMLDPSNLNSKKKAQLDSLLYYSVNNLNPQPWLDDEDEENQENRASMLSCEQADMTSTWQPQEHVLKSWHSQQALLQIEEECDRIVTDVEENYSLLENERSKLHVSRAEKQNCSLDMNSTTQSMMQDHRYQAIESMCRLEEIFIQIMQFGVYRYSRPLRHCIMSPQQHAVMFQNMEKLAMISEYHARNIQEQILHETKTTDYQSEQTENIGGIYRPKIQMMCEAYELYCKGLPQALGLLDELKNYQEFQKFLLLSASEVGQPTLATVLQWPERHIRQLLTTMNAIYSQTLPCHPDFYNLKDVVSSLERCLNMITTAVREGSRKSHHRSSSTLSTTSTATTRSRKTTTSRATTSSVQSFASTALSTASVDSEVVEIQNNLKWDKDIQKIQLATPNRHVIYSGELLWVDSWRWVKVHVILFSDLLLLTLPDENNQLTVIEAPVYLWDISNCDFGCYHPSEFSLTIMTNPSQQPHQMTFRAQCIEQKCTWKNILEHRIRSCRASQDLLMTRDCEAISL